MDIVFLGGLFPKETENEIRNNSVGNVQDAANNLQWECVRGLDINNKNTIKIINSLYIGSFPKRYKKLRIDTYKFDHENKNNAIDINVGFLNFIGIKNLSRYLSIKPHIKNWATDGGKKKKVIIAYAMTATFTRALRYAKKINPHIITCLIVPDLPEYMNTTKSQNPVYNFLKNIEIALIKADEKKIDAYVVLTEHMKTALKIKVPSIVMEGISTDLFDQIKTDPKSNQIKTVLYSGGLNEKYGIITLVKAFNKTKNQDFRLVICGTGDAEKEIIKYSKLDNRIIYKGLVSRQEVLKLQKSATVLINPRPNNEEFTKYSFPSKILEYLSSGTPVLAYKLDGIPQEYYKYIYTIDEGDDGMYNALNNVLEKPQNELVEKGELAKRFVTSEKNSEVQIGKILEMLSSITS